MKFKNIIVGVIEETENEFIIEQFLKNSDTYEVVEEETKEDAIKPGEAVEEVEEVEEAEIIEETKTPKNKK